MPVFYNYTENGVVYSFDNVFVPIDAFRQGNLWTWGYNYSGQLGINIAGPTTHRTTPVTTFSGGANWKQVAAGFLHSAAIKTDGTLWTWGAGGNGQLGNNAVTARSTPITTFLGGNTWKQVTCGSSSVAAIKTDGTLWVWGQNSYGNLGDNTSTNRCTPVTTFTGGTNWKQVSGVSYVVSAIKTDGTLWTWGNNGVGQLGDNTTTNRCTPVTTFIGGTNWKQVFSNSNCTAAIKTDGTLWTWGRNSYGQLGDNTTTNRCTPVTTFAGGTNWKQVFGDNGYVTAAIKTDGTLWTWGAGSLGEIGDNTLVNRTTPVTTFAGGTNWKQVSGGLNHIVAIKTDGTLWTWGNNSYGQLGDNTTTKRCTPVTTFLGGSTWNKVSGNNHTIASTYIDDYV